MSNGLTGASALAYQGTNAPTPPNVFVYPRAPTPNNYQGFSIGDFWVYQVSKTANNSELWTLMGKAANIADWVLISNSVGAILTLTGNTGGAVGPTLGNVNIVGSGDISVAGNPVTSTLTISLSGGADIVSTLTGNSGGAVSPSAGNINVVGDGTTISIVGNPATHTLTASVIGGEAANSFPTDNLTAHPIGGVLNVLGGTSARDINTSAPGSSNTIHVDLNNTITLGDLAVIAPGSASLTLTTGDIHLDGGTASAATNPKIVFGPNNNLISFFLNNVFLGQNTGNTTMTGLFNYGVGSYALSSITSGAENHAFGNGALQSCTTGGANVSIGYTALQNLVTGSYNVVIGSVSGAHYTGAESNNILLNNAGVIGESNILRIGVTTGSGTGELAKAFVQGIRGITTDAADAVAVLISSTGQLGTISSSIKVKDNVQDMADSSSRLMQLRPVTFNYKTYPADKVEYGLIAEEVESLFPELVVYNQDGEVETVKYHVLSSLLLNELQKLTKRVKDLESKLSI